MTVVSPCTQNLMDSAHPHTVLRKLNEQRLQGLFCDVTIVVEDVKFQAHRNILAACSGYFKNALTSPDTWSSNQVLELLDLKSEVFASILNFIYCSKVTSVGAEETGGLVAAGKRLGIPFLEKLAEQEKQDFGKATVQPKCVKTADPNIASVHKKAKKEGSRPDEADNTRGPRITNAFSITEVGPGNNPFTPLVQVIGEKELPDVAQHSAGCPTTSCISGNNETTHALSEHSYAVCQPTEGKDTCQWDKKNVCKPSISQSKQLAYRNAGPLKKRHRLRGTLGRTIVPTPSESHTDTPNNNNATALADSVAVAPVAVMTPPSLFSQVDSEKSISTTLPMASDDSQIELGPPNLSPHTDDSISIYGCEECPEIFTNKALLSTHSKVHKKHFVSHLFCKFCHKRFIHLKRLRNHEQVCTESVRSLPEKNAIENMAKDMDLNSDDMPNIENMTQLPPRELSTSCTPKPFEEDQSEHPREKKAIQPCGQRRYNCSVCKRVYVTLSSLKRHENVHSWQRAYPCHYCNKVFALAEYRTKHELWHTGERRYQCIFCLETFLTYYILKNHQKSFHGIDPRLSVKKKSANGGLKASVYPIKLYRLLPMKFRKRQYKSYSQTYSESTDKSDQTTNERNSVGPHFENNAIVSLSDSISLPMTFMATTTMVAPVTPRISFDKQGNQDPDESFNTELETCHHRGTRKDAELPYPLQCDTEPPVVGYKDDPPLLINSELTSHDTSFLSSLNTVKKLSELSVSAKRVEDMTKEILLSGTEMPAHDKIVGAKTETYIAKPACPGPSVHGNTMPLCQITVKIGNEAIIRRRIKGSKLFPKKKKRIRELKEVETPDQCLPIKGNSESPRLRHRTDASAAAKLEIYDDPNDEPADQLWRPYYSYKAKKKRKKLRFKHRKSIYHNYSEVCADRMVAGEAHLNKHNWLTEESISAGSAEVKRNLSRNSSPRANYNCDICNSSFITETGLKAHVIGSHPCFCRTCGKQGPPGEVPAGGDYICNNCMENGSCFDNTPRSPSTEKRYRCSFCPQRFLYLATKKSHEKKHKETSEEGYISENFTSCSERSVRTSEEDKQHTIKKEESDNQAIADSKSDNLGYFPLEKIKPKIEDTTEFASLTTYQDISSPNIKPPVSPCTDPLFSVSPLKIKHKMANKRKDVQHSMHRNSKKQTCERDRDDNKDHFLGPRTNNHDDREKSSNHFQKNDSETKGTISIHKQDKWMCKQEAFY
ncbi:zinc finger and BTB domain-containing protein 38 isoform X2 [Thalassophryne amazonica]|nr:zinc finger and BTB domain-containing protein 38 isoform X2 [Thalassophryne amazonica]XP_034024054.1 zinc finger and BTB domain-containing protein 38 isoform X2 [Thalassophryne amazonica]